MSDAKRCDRCGRYFDAEGEGRTVAAYPVGCRSSRERTEDDLCPRCADRFESWMRCKRYEGGHDE